MVRLFIVVISPIIGGKIVYCGYIISYWWQDFFIAVIFSIIGDNTVYCGYIINNLW